MSTLIKQSSANGFQIYEKNDGNDYLAILQDFIEGKIQYKTLTSGNEQRDVFLIEANHRKYVLKWDREMDPRLEKRIWQIISGPYYSNLIRRVAEATHAGCNVTGDIYLVAEKAVHRQSEEAYILIEYVEGKPLADHSNIDEYKTEIFSCIHTLHQYGLASNDAHAGNFIIADTGLKVIDLSDRGALSICQANDALALKRFYGIDLELKGFVAHLIATKEKLKRFSRKLRGKA